MSSQFLMNQAVQFHQRGDILEAERLCLQVLRAEAGNLMAKNMLGIIRYQQGRNEEALPLIGAVLKANPNAFGVLTNYGLVQHALRRFQDALKTFDRALALQPRAVGALFNRANTLREMNRLEEALAGYDKANAVEPSHVGALYNGANLLWAMQRFEASLARYDKVLALQPGFVGAVTNRANALRDLKRFDEAFAGYEKALALDPRHGGALYNRAATFADLRRFDEALAGYDKAIEADPTFVEALEGRGKVLQEFRRFEEALACYDSALKLRPDAGSVFYNRAIALADLGRLEETLASYDRSIALNPAYPEAFYNRGMVLWQLSRMGEAVASYDKALALRPDYTAAWNNRGIALQALNRFDEALPSYERALAITPTDRETLYNRANLLWSEFRRHGDAVADLERILAISPDQEYIRGDLLHLRMHTADWGEFARESAAIHEGVRAGQRIVRPFAYQALSESPADLRRCAEIFTGQFFPPVAAAPPTLSGSDKIRVGYVSGEFYEQATAFLMAGLYERHDKNAFEIIALDSAPRPDSPMRARLQAAFDRFIDISMLPDAAAAKRIAAEGIDILINLNGYFGRTRMGIFAHRPAPIQVNYLGFPATLGADYIDYLIADRVVIPEEERTHYLENVVYLPGSYQVNDDTRAIASVTPSRADCGLPEDAFVFCNFNQSYKLLPATFAAWMRILRQHDGSVLWLLKNNPAFQDNIRRHAAAAGIDPGRLVFADHQPMPEHLARLQRADLFLDSTPYNAHTTASDALWAGVPLITLRGHAFPGRVAESVLRAVGLQELVTDTPEAYEALALDLARNPATLNALRQKLAANRGTQPLFDTDGFRRHLESAYTRMLEIHKRGEAPHSFSVA